MNTKNACSSSKSEFFKNSVQVSEKNNLVLFHRNMLEIDASISADSLENNAKTGLGIDTTLKLAVDNTVEQPFFSMVSEGPEEIINQLKLQEIEDISAGLAGQMIACFITDCDHLIQSFSEACITVDFIKTVDIAHAIKGTALQLGAERLAEYCKSLKTIKRSKFDEMADTINKEIKYLYAEARNSLLAYSHEGLESLANQHSF